MLHFPKLLQSTLTLAGAGFLGFALLAAPAAQAADTPPAVSPSEMTPEAKAQFATDTIRELEAGIAEVGRLAETAKAKSASSEEIKCIESRLASLKALRTAAKQAAANMVQALDAKDTEKADFAFRQISIARTKGAELVSEAQRCDETGSAGTGSTTSSPLESPTGADDDQIYQDMLNSVDMGWGETPDVSPFS